MKAILVPAFRLNLSYACDSSTFTSSRRVRNRPATHSPVNKDRKLDKALAIIVMAISLTVIASETCEVVDDYTYLNCATCNFDTIGSGSAKGNGSGRYITFTLDTPVLLAPNTVYGFDVGGGQLIGVVSGPKHYWETD